MNIEHLVITMPAYNESDGIAGFVQELHTWTSPLACKVTIIVVDDSSTDDTVALLEALAADGSLAPTTVLVKPQPLNRGHGPTALTAYQEALALNPDVLVHIDGDGQFLGRDFPRMIAALTDDVDVVHGVRVHRTDPWYRKTLTGFVRVAATAIPGRNVTDVNTPFRVYRPEIARLLVETVGSKAIVPHVHFSIAEMRWGLRRVEVRVKNIPRRGATSSGTMWGKNQSSFIPPKRLRQFMRQALRELWHLSLKPGAPLKKKPTQS